MAYDPEAFSAFTQANFELRDRPLRGAIGGKIRDFFTCFDNKVWDGMISHLTSDAKLIDILHDPNDIYIGDEAVIDQFREIGICDQRTVHQLLLVDRGRITCCTSRFYTHGDNDEDGQNNGNRPAMFTKKREVWIIDLDDEYQIRRIERRGTADEELECVGDLKAMNQAVLEAKTNAIEMVDFV